MKKLLLAIVMLLALTPEVKAQDPPFTRLELRVAAKRQLNQDTSLTTNITWNDDELNYLINEGIAYISKLTKAVVRDTTWILIVNGTIYTMPANWIEGIGMTNYGSGYKASEASNTPRGVPVTPPWNMGFVAGDRKTAPMQFQDLGESERQIEITPSPSDPDSVRMVYAAYGRYLTADTGTIGTCDLPNGMQMCLKDYVCWQAWKKTRGANPYKTDFFEGIAPFVANRPKAPVGQPLPVQDPAANP